MWTNSCVDAPSKLKVISMYTLVVCSRLYTTPKGESNPKHIQETYSGHTHTRDTLRSVIQPERVKKERPDIARGTSSFWPTTWLGQTPSHNQRQLDSQELQHNQAHRLIGRTGSNQRQQGQLTPRITRCQEASQAQKRMQQKPMPLDTIRTQFSYHNIPWMH